MGAIAPIELFQRFQVRAHAYAHRLRYSPELVNQAVGILRASFGDEWLGAQDDAPGIPFSLGRHPLRMSLPTAGDSQIMDVLELCQYLKSVPGATAAVIIANLKSSYGDTVPQLAFAYRLVAAGATGVHLEPPAAGGRLGDIGFQWAETPFMAECYAPTVAKRGEGTAEELRLAHDIMRLLEGRTDAMSLAVRLVRPLVSAHRKAVVRAIYAAIKEPVTTQFIELDGTTVSVAPTRWVGPGVYSCFVTHGRFNAAGEPDMFSRVAYGDREQLFSILGVPPTGETGSHVGIWYDQETRVRRSIKKPLGPELNRLATKTERKLGQTRRADAPARLLIVRTWIAREFDRAEPDAIRALGRRLIDQHERVAGVLIVARRWDSAATRHRYLIHPVAGVGRPGADICESLQKQESQLLAPPAPSTP